MSQDQLRAAMDAIRARLEAELDAQLTSLLEREAQAVDAARRAAEVEAEERWSVRVDETRAEWAARLQSELAAAAAESERRAEADAVRFRAETEQAIARARDEVRRELEQVLASERERAQQQLDVERARAEQVLNDERAAAQREIESSRALAQDAADETRRTVREELESEIRRVRADADAAREALVRDLEAERRRSQELDIALEEAQAALVVSREEARSAAAAAADEQARSAATLNDSLVAEREWGLAVVERLLGSIKAISAARSLSETLTALVEGAAAEAPRAALFIVKERQLQGLRAVNFDLAADPLRASLDDANALAEAALTGEAVSMGRAGAPAFARLPSDRAGLAVPVTVGGQAVAVLYADDATSEHPDAPTSWPEAVQILGRHASACLAHLTAVRTAQAMRAGFGRSARSSPPQTAAAPATPHAEDENSARRYARLLVSEIKLYNESAVRVGREKRDLLERLRPEIERARRLYEERVPQAASARGQYFQQELVQTLADGDPALLGSSK